MTAGLSLSVWRLRLAREGGDGRRQRPSSPQTLIHLHPLFCLQPHASPSLFSRHQSAHFSEVCPGTLPEMLTVPGSAQAWTSRGDSLRSEAVFSIPAAHKIAGKDQRVSTRSLKNRMRASSPLAAQSCLCCSVPRQTPDTF